MLKRVLLLLFTVAFSNALFAQTGAIKGKVSDNASGETIPFANVAVEKGGSVVAVVQTNMDGEFTIKPLVAGDYNLKASMVGYSPQQVNRVRVSPDKTTYHDFTLGQGKEMAEVVITEYKVPLIDPNGIVGKTTDRKQYQAMASKSVSSVASLTAGVTQSDEGRGLNARGTRGSAQGGESSIDTYIDGVRVRGGKVPQQGIEQINMTVGGMPAQYGDATGGILNITTRGPQPQHFGGVELVSSQITDAYGYNLLGFSAGGPILNKKDTTTGVKKTVLGYMISGELETTKDNSPSAIGGYKINSDSLRDLENHPLMKNPDGTGTLKRAEYLGINSYEKIKAKQNVRNNRIVLNAKLDYQPIKDLNITVGGNLDYQKYNSYVYNYALFNSVNNPSTNALSFVLWGRVQQKLNFGNDNGDEKSSSIISNAYYSINASYEKIWSEQMHPQHGKNYFDYGYVGKFKTYKGKFYAPGPDGNLYMIDNFDTLVTFERSEINPNLANYTSDYYNYVNSRPSNLFEIIANGAPRNGDRLGSNNPFSLYYNTGRNIAGYSLNDDRQLRVYANFNLDLFKTHSIQFGFDFEQRDDRGYSVGDAAGLWNQMRLLTNQHLSLDRTKPIYNDALSASANVYDFNYKADLVAQTNFDKNLRVKLGLKADGTEWIDIDSYAPSTFDITMFSPDELLNRSGGSFISNQGYDVYGNRLSKNSEYADFFSAKNDKGQYTRNSPAFQPIYSAAYIQYKFDYHDMKFNIGIRADRFDANQKMFKDPFSLYKIKTVGEMKSSITSLPSNITDEFIPYTNTKENQTTIVGYRDPNSETFNPKWYDLNGKLVNNPADLSGKLYPFLVSPENSKDPSSEKAYEHFALTDYVPIVNFMPRLAFSFPISDVANFFAHYDIIVQRPSNNAYNDPFSVLSFLSSTGPFLNNGLLKPEKTTDYEFGFTQVLNDAKNSALTISAYYKEMKDNISVINVNYAYPQNYQTYSNVDFGTTKGLNVSYDFRRTGHVQFNVAYTLMFADGTSSNSTSGLNIINNGQPNLRSPIPLDYDQRHNVVGTFDYRYESGTAYDGPMLFGKELFANAGINVTARTGSGTPYSGQTYPTASALMGVSTRSTLKGSINGNRKPWTYKFDIRIDKNFEINCGKANEEGKQKKLNLNIYLQVLNVLNTINVLDVYAFTGTPDDDGYLSSAQGVQSLNSQNNPAAYSLLYGLSVNNPSNYSLPRQTRIGLALDF